MIPIIEKILLFTLFLFSFSALILLYIYFLVKNKYFPYKELIKCLSSKAKWSIGIIHGNPPFNYSEFERLANPVLTAKSVSDTKAKFVADPFLLKKDNIYYMFFEVYNLIKNKGEIGYAESKDCYNWTYRNIVLSEPFHVSYPYVFKHEDKYYLIPESSETLSIRLYEALEFPSSWKIKKELIVGEKFADNSIIYYENMFYLFTYIEKSLFLYYSDDLFGKWKLHPKAPIVKHNLRYSRPGGRLLIQKDKLYRFAQDSYPYYGTKLWTFEIVKITPTDYSETLIGEIPKFDWNRARMHHIDHLFINNEFGYICAIDGIQESILLRIRDNLLGMKDWLLK